jgi:type II secretory pathway component PulJ
MSEDRLTTRGLAQANERSVAMFPGEEAAGYRTRWDAIQTGFVDEPRKAVEEGDALVAQMIKRLTEVFANERTTLEHQWDSGEQVSTEDLRQALRTYRSFFERLLAV